MALALLRASPRWGPLAADKTAYADMDRQHIGVVTFDSAIHFYSFNADRTGYHMLLVPDGERPFAPAASSSLLVPLHTASDTVSPRHEHSWPLCLHQFVYRELLLVEIPL